MSIARSKNRFLLSMKGSSYLFGISGDGLPVNLHWGAPAKLSDIPDADCVRSFLHRPGQRARVVRQEYPAWHGALFTEPALKLSGADGVRNCEPLFQSAEIHSGERSETLEIRLSDPLQSIAVTLFYRTYCDSPLMERWAVIRNTGTLPRTLESVMSACFQLPQLPRNYRLTHLHGRWGREAMIDRVPVPQTKTVLESRSGLSGSNAMPFFALDQGDATEEQGDVWFGTLHWSGNWKITVEQDGYGDTSVCGGIHDFDFAWDLNPGEEFKTPVFSFGFTDGGFGEMTKILHRHYRLHMESPEFRGTCQPLIVNTYAAFGSGPEMNERNCLAQLEKSAEIGCELFILDAGWQQSVGEWVPHREKFSRGLRPLADRAHELGIKFGIWAELESADLDSKTCREHPEWIMTFPQQGFRSELCETPGRALLNFAIPDVMEAMYEAIDRQITENGLDYFKIDMNRCFSMPGWADPPSSGARSIWVRYVENVHELFTRLQSRHPKLMMENCACGNGRADWGMQRFFGRCNRSDNQDSLDELKLHEGFSYLHLPKFAGGGCHISLYTGLANRRTIPLQFQAYTGMLGSLAIGRNLSGCSETELAAFREYGSLFKKLRNAVHNGDFYRIASHFDHPYAVYEYVLPDTSEAVVFLFGHALQFSDRLPLFRLRGLDPEGIYELSSYGTAEEGSEKYEKVLYDAAEYLDGKRSGAGLMSVGIRAALFGDFASRIVHIRKTEGSSL